MYDSNNSKQCNNQENYKQKMNRRQSFPESHRQNLASLQQIKDLKLQIDLKNHEIEDLKFELNTLRKKQSIWHHLGQTYEKSNGEQEKKMLLAENQKLKAQVVSMVKEMDRKDDVIQDQAEKINDLKHDAAELRKFAQKIEQIHKKQLQLLKSSSETVTTSQYLNLKKQKQKLQHALSECDTISKQMQQYYMSKIQIQKQQLEEQKNVIIRLEDSKNKLEQELGRKDRDRQRERDREVFEVRGFQRSMHDGREKENQINQLIMRQNLEKKWEIVLTQVRDRYEKQVSQLKDQIRFLIVKIESMQDSKACYQGLTSSILTQSKMAMSSASHQSFKFTPNNSFSSSIKQSLSRKDLGPMRTPSKSSRQSNNIGYLLDRTNL